MQVEVVKTSEAYRTIAGEADPAARPRYLLEMLAPFAPLFSIFGVRLDGEPERATSDGTAGPRGEWPSGTAWYAGSSTRSACPS